MIVTCDLDAVVRSMSRHTQSYTRMHTHSFLAAAQTYGSFVVVSAYLTGELSSPAAMLASISS